MREIALILAGGTGSKLWPRSGANKPKQFRQFLGEGAMLQNTFNRIRRKYELEDIYIVTFADYEKYVLELLPDFMPENFLGEPAAKGTAIAIALSLEIIGQKIGYDFIATTFPADHFISNEIDFLNTVENAIEATKQLNSFVCLGVEPAYPATNYGYVQFCEDEIEGDLKANESLKKVATFAEKPDYNTAKRFIESGDFIWNTGVLTFKYNIFKSAFSKYMNDDFLILSSISELYNTELYSKALAEVYAKVSGISIDYGILERAENIAMIKSNFAWSDLGNWDEYYRLAMKDGSGNVVDGNTAVINSRNCVVSAQDKFIGIVNVDNLIVVEDDDAILICKRGDSDAVKIITDFMERVHISNFSNKD